MENAKVLVMPLWLNHFIVVSCTIGIILMGVCLFIAILAQDILYVFIHAVIQLGLLECLVSWNKNAYITIEPKERIKPYSPSKVGANAALLPKGEYVYLIQDVSVTGYFKIGRTNLPAKRLNDFGVQLPMKLEIIHVITCNDMVSFEKALHKTFAKYRVNGEWFALEEVAVEYIKTL